MCIYAFVMLWCGCIWFFSSSVVIEMKDIKPNVYTKIDKRKWCFVVAFGCWLFFGRVCVRVFTLSQYHIWNIIYIWCIHYTVENRRCMSMTMWSYDFPFPLMLRLCRCWNSFRFFFFGYFMWPEFYLHFPNCWECLRARMTGPNTTRTNNNACV